MIKFLSCLVLTVLAPVVVYMFTMSDWAAEGVIAGIWIGAYVVPRLLKV